MTDRILAFGLLLNFAAVCPGADIGAAIPFPVVYGASSCPCGVSCPCGPDCPCRVDAHARAASGVVAHGTAAATAERRLVLVTATWCLDPCRTAKEAAAGVPGVVLLDYDRDAERLRAMWRGAKAEKTAPDGRPAVVPAWLLIEDGVVVGRWTGTAGPSWVRETLGPAYYTGSGARPADMPPRKGDREFDGGPDFGNGSWAERDPDDGEWRRFGG
jgi:hypothetical protein